MCDIRNTFCFKNIELCFPKRYMRSMFPWQVILQQNDRRCLLVIMQVSDWCRYTASNLTDRTVMSTVNPSRGEGRRRGKKNDNKQPQSQPLAFPLSLWGQKFPVEEDTVWHKKTKHLDNMTQRGSSGWSSPNSQSSRTDYDEMMGMKSASPNLYGNNTMKSLHYRSESPCVSVCDALLLPINMFNFTWTN